MLRPALLVVLPVLCSVPLIAQNNSPGLQVRVIATANSGDFQRELVEIHAKWFEAFDAGDGATMDRLETSDLTLIMPNGEIWHKSEPRAGKQGKGDTGAKRQLSNVSVRVFGNTAVLTGVVTTQGTRPDESGKSATTVVFTRTASGWKVASAQWTEISGK
jgi:ketosteroid isomerase-like protein